MSRGEFELPRCEEITWPSSTNQLISGCTSYHFPPATSVSDIAENSFNLSFSAKILPESFQVFILHLFYLTPVKFFYDGIRDAASQRRLQDHVTESTFAASADSHCGQQTRVRGHQDSIA